MELIENTFGLLADQIVTMRSPRELSGQLDDLADGVEAVKTTARETDAQREFLPLIFQSKRPDGCTSLPV